MRQYGQVLEDGSRFICDAQIGKSMTWEKMLNGGNRGARVFTQVMSMKLICDVCGKSYALVKRCPHCGACVPDDEGIHQSWEMPGWGWLVISLPKNFVLRKEHLKLLKARLQKLEGNSVMTLLLTQVDLLDSGSDFAYVLTRADFVNSLVEHNGGAFDFNFQKVNAYQAADDLNALILAGPTT